MAPLTICLSGSVFSHRFILAGIIQFHSFVNCTILLTSCSTEIVMSSGSCRACLFHSSSSYYFIYFLIDLW